MARAFTIEAQNLVPLRIAFGQAAREGDLATIHALNRVGSLSRTRIVREVAREAGVGKGNQKHVRARVRVYRATLRKMRVKVWHGLAARLRYKEIGRNVIRNATGRLMKLASGYEGVFRDHKNGELTEVTLDLAPYVERLAEPLVGKVYDARFRELFTRDLERRLVRRGWRPG